MLASVKMEILAIVFALFLGSALSVPLSKTDLDWRIVGGSNAPDGQYPYQISLRTRAQNSHFCGGSIISSSYILTAAHCMTGQTASGMTVVVGTNTLNAGGTAYGVAHIISHQGYSPQNNVNDIAIVRIAGSIAFNNKVQPVRLATSVTPGGVQLILSGWGLTSYPSNNLPNNLQHIGLTSITVAQCQNALQGFPIYNTNVCTHVQSGYGACQGDSGGPLCLNGVQVGVVSWGIPCAKGNPDIFTSVAAFRDWIRQNSGV